MSFPELAFLEHLLPEAARFGEIRTLASIPHGRSSLPIHSICFGNTKPEANCVAFIGGVHGQEKIGSQVVLSFLETFLSLIRWDSQTQNLLANMRVVFLPILNPVGMLSTSRPNGNGIDLMRNAPIKASDKSTFLLGGQNFSRHLPWYRGPLNAPMQTEATVLCDFIREYCFPSKTSIILDVHSGFGAIDRLWFPYAKTFAPTVNVSDFYSFFQLLNHTHPNHVYRMEPVAKGYTISGDLWDFLFDEFHEKKNGGRFLPLTLEMGSWIWLKKNPAQILDPLGLFHPIHKHRTKRILRRHQTLFDFLLRSANSPSEWSNHSELIKKQLTQDAIRLWYS